MSPKTLTYTGLIIGSTIGSFVPTLWGDSPLSITAVLFSGVGGILGIIVGYSLIDRFS